MLALRNRSRGKQTTGAGRAACVGLVLMASVAVLAGWQEGVQGAPDARAPDPTTKTAVPATRAPWPEDAYLTDVVKECPDLRPAIDKMHEEHFEEAADLLRAYPRDKPCAKPAYDVEQSGIMDIGRQWEFVTKYKHPEPDPRLGLRGSQLEFWYDKLLDIARVPSPFRDRAMRLLVPDGLDFWVKLAKEQCPYLGAIACVETAKAVRTIAPQSPQAEAVSAILAEESRIDAEMTPIYKKARVIMQRRARRCMRAMGGRTCWAYKQAAPTPEAVKEFLETDDPFAERPGCASWWDKSPATLRINAEWDALLAKVPYEGRRRFLSDGWIGAANYCNGNMVIPWEKRPSVKRPSVTAAEPWEKLVDYSQSSRECSEFLGTECHQTCVRYVATLVPVAAAKGVDCLRRVSRGSSNGSPACADPCTQATCTEQAFDGARGVGDQRCQHEVRAAILRDTSDASYVTEMVRQCEAYTSRMNGRGRDRFIACVLTNWKMGYRVCLGDASVAPCGHDEHHRERDIDLDQ